MESVSYEGWTIATQPGSRGYTAVITDPCGNVYHQVSICWKSKRSARRYAQEFIDQSIKLEEEHRQQE